MSTNLRLPSISGAGNDHERLQQMERYLFSLVEQLQFALGAVEGSASGATVMPTTINKSETIVVGDKFDPEVAFAELKPLIIKSADIAIAYYETMKETFEGTYLAISDFGSFKEDTELALSKSSTEIEQVYTNVQQISTEIRTENFESIEAAKELLNGNIDSLGNNISNDIAGLEGDIDGLKGDVAKLDYSLIEVNANVKTGLLYYDAGEIPVYGLEIGQRTWLDGEEVFNKFARFTADRLSFYDQNGTEVAYVSDYKLYMRSVEITKSLKIGGYVDTVMDDGRVITKWVGGERANDRATFVRRRV